MEDITGKAIEEGHHKSVIAGMIGLETLRQTAEYQEAGLEKFKRKVMEFVNLVMSGDGRGGDSMDIGRIEENSNEQWADIEFEEWHNTHEVNGLGETCLKCGGIGHYARECPSKGKGKGKSTTASNGKGKGKGDEKGSKGKGKGKAVAEKGKGKGKAAPQFGSCWTCGGAHFSSDCSKGAASAGICVGNCAEIF